MTQPIENWYKITFDNTAIYLNIHPSEKEAKKIEIEWTTIERVCFKPGNYIESDEIYIPAEAFGGLELWNEIIRRRLFDAQLAIVVAAKSEGVFCWPEE